jgi:hypothetical protein
MFKANFLFVSLLVRSPDWNLPLVVAAECGIRQPRAFVDCVSHKTVVMPVVVVDHCGECVSTFVWTVLHQDIVIVAIQSTAASFFC